MKLFHHFQTCTQHTLVFGPEVWEHALQLSCEFESLMHAILCISARHLSYLCPDEGKYPAAAAAHLSRTLRLFREDLTHNFSVSNIDAFMATATLLHYELWVNTDFVLSGPNGTVAIDPSRDPIFDLCAGMQCIFLNSLPHMSERPSVFGPVILHSPRVVLAEAAKINRCTLQFFQSFFAYKRALEPQLLTAPLPSYTRGVDMPPQECWGPGRRVLTLDIDEDDEVGDLNAEAYENVVPRLCLMLSFLPEAQDLDVECSGALSDDLLPDFSRYVFTFPALCERPFAQMVKRGDPKALVLMYHFYRAVRISLSGKESCWWAQKRASSSEILLRDLLVKECARTAESLG